MNFKGFYYFSVMDRHRGPPGGGDRGGGWQPRGPPGGGGGGGRWGERDRWGDR